MAEPQGPFVIRLYLADPEDVEVTKAVVGPFDTSTLAAEALEAAGYRRRRQTEDALLAQWEPEWVEIVPLLESMPRE